MKYTESLLFILVICFSCGPKKETTTENRQDEVQYSVVKVFPHDTKAFTQGLTIHQGRLFESTGQENSWIAEVNIATGEQEKKIVLDPKFFGEGITILNNKVYQLTWQNHVGFVYNFKNFEKLSEFKNEHEGWGITSDDKNLILSDGTDKLYFLDTATLQVSSSIAVRENNIPQSKLNELEYVDGHVYANQWQTNYILKIDPSNGNVVGRMDLTDLAAKAQGINSQADVLNGIAYEKKSKLLLVTGKHWPVLYALRLKSDTTKAL